MEKNEHLKILFDYPQIELKLSNKGNDIHSYYLSKNLSKISYLLSIKPKSDPLFIEKETGVIYPLHKFITGIPLKINFYAQFVSLFIKRKTNIVYSRFDYSILNQLGLLYSIILNKPIISELNGIPWEEQKGFIYNNRLMRKLNLFQLKKSDSIICVSKDIKESLLREINYNPNKVYVVPNGVDIELFKPSDSNLLNKKYKIIKKTKIITFVGVVEKWQGLDLLILVANNLINKNYKDFKFLIVGDGTYLDNIKQSVIINKLENHFIFTGKVLQKEVPDYINLSDFCICPFVKNRKASPIKIFEYMACDKKVLSSDIKDVKDLGLKYGIDFYHAENSESCAKEIIRILKSKSNLKKGKIRNQITKNYTWKITAKKVYDIIVKTLDENTK